jgi:hypothetical protein
MKRKLKLIGLWTAYISLIVVMTLLHMPTISFILLGLIGAPLLAKTFNL